MIKVRTSVLALLFGIVALGSAAISYGQNPVTLYSINKHRGEQEQRVFCMNFRSGAMGYSGRTCDLRYGSLYVGDDLDWFQSSAAFGNRSVIKDLGKLTWDEEFTIPVVQPLPKLKPGEQRHVSIDASGADGVEGRPGEDGRDGIGGDMRMAPIGPTSTDKMPAPARRKHDGKPRVDPMFVKAVLGHMYVIRVVNDVDDFYVAFRVEEVERGSKCTISWRIVPDPPAVVVAGKK
jgi:hypothetical protein